MLYAKTDTPYADNEQKLIAEALKVRMAVESSDSSTYFKKLRSPSLNYMFACLMIIFLHHKYLQAIETMKQRFV